MTENDRGSERAETARRHDDSDIIDRMEDAPGHSGAQGHNINRLIGAEDEIRQVTEDGDGVTRVRDSHKKEEANLPRFNDS
jgi:hypothetical protein